MSRFTLLAIILFLFNTNQASACSLTIEEETLGAQLEAVARAGFIGYGRTIISSTVEDVTYTLYESPSIYAPSIPGCGNVIATATVTVTYETSYNVCTTRLGVIYDNSEYRIETNHRLETNNICNPK